MGCKRQVHLDVLAHTAIVYAASTDSPSVGLAQFFLDIRGRAWRDYFRSELPRLAARRSTEGAHVMGNTKEGYVLAPDKAEMLQLKAGPMALLASAETSGGSLAAWRDRVSPGDELPLHIHHKADEFFYILEGQFAFTVGDRTEQAPAGGFVFIPKGTPHGYKNVGSEVGILLGFVSPAGLESFYRAQAKMPPGQMTPTLYRELAAKYDMDIIV